MELTKASFIDRLNLISSLLKENGDTWEDLCNKLKEKGTEYCIVFPLFEIMLGYDPLQDFIMESYSDTMNDQRFDFVVKSKDEGCSLLVEAKSIKETSLTNHEKQIARYMKANERFPWGILTNGIKWTFYISKKHLEQEFNSGGKINLPKDDIIKLFSLDLQEELFIPIMESLSKGSLRDFWYNLGRFTARVLLQQTTVKAYSGKNNINTFLVNKIKEEVEIKTGIYWEAIKSGELKEGDKVTCKNSFIEMNFILDAGGRLVLNEGCLNLVDLNQFLVECERNPNAVQLIAELARSTNTFTDNKSIIRKLVGVSSVSSNMLDKFPFDPGPPKT